MNEETIQWQPPASLHRDRYAPSLPMDMCIYIKNHISVSTQPNHVTLCEQFFIFVLSQSRGIDPYYHLASSLTKRNRQNPQS